MPTTSSPGTRRTLALAGRLAPLEALVSSRAPLEALTDCEFLRLLGLEAEARWLLSLPVSKLSLLEEERVRDRSRPGLPGPSGRRMGDLAAARPVDVGGPDPRGT